MRKKPVPEVRCDFPAATLKGLIERGDATAYFASLGGFLSYLRDAIDRGWIVDTGDKGEFGQALYKPTDAGKQHYESSGLKDLPKEEYGRAYMWDWTHYKAP